MFHTERRAIDTHVRFFYSYADYLENKETFFYGFIVDSENFLLGMCIYIYFFFNRLVNLMLLPI